MDIKEIKAIVDLMKRSSLTEFEIEEKDLKLRICRRGEEIQTVYQAPTPAPFPMGTPAPMPAALQQDTPPAAPEKPPADDSKLIKSPMVGTYYSAPSPDSPPFVNTGDTVNEQTIVCIVEAMKVMNEIHAEVNGKIAEILVQNGDNVEYGQALFRLQ